MIWQHTPYTWVLMLTAGIAFWLAIYAWRRRSTPGGIYFAGMMLAIAEWTLTAALEIAVVDIPAKIWWAKAQYLGSTSVPPLWLSFALSYSGKEKWLARRKLRLLWVIPIAIMTMAMLNEWHRLLWTEITPVPTSAPAFITTVLLVYGHGPFFWFAILHNYVLLIGGMVLLLRVALQSLRLYRRQAVALLSTVVILLVVNVIYLAGWGPIPGMDFTHITFALGGIIIVWGIFRLQLLDVVPVAREMLIENMRDGVLVLDAQQRVVDINPQARQFIHNDQEIVGQQAGAVLATLPGLQTQLRADQGSQMEGAITIYDVAHWLEVHTTPLYSHRQQFTGWLIVLHEITARKQAEAELQQAKAAAEEANHAKSAFLANMSHELRTPLNAILGYAQILIQRTHLNPLQYDGIQIISRSGQHLLTLINDILDLSRIEARKLELFPAEMVWPRFIVDIVSMMRLQAQQKGLKFYDEIDVHIPEVLIADARRLRQILLNLLGNAIKFTEEGSVTLRVREGEEARKRGSEKARRRINESTNWPLAPGTSPDLPSTACRLNFEVRDTGPGVPPEQLEAIFLPFEQADPRHTHVGAGLGLSISQRLVALMGGEIYVQSQVGEGSIFGFELTFPVAASTVAATTALETRRIMGYEGARQKLLIVDDHQDNRALLCDLLEPLGFEICLAEDGQAAIEQAQAQQPDLILMDLVMPVKSGATAVRELRAMDAFKNTPIIAISASLLNVEPTRQQLLGCDAFLLKPIATKQLLNLLVKHLPITWRYETVAAMVCEQQGADTVLTEDSTKSPVSTLEKLIAPPRPELEALYELALFGNMKKISARAIYLENLDPRYSALARKLQVLAADFESAQIEALIKQLLEW